MNKKAMPAINMLIGVAIILAVILIIFLTPSIRNIIINYTNTIIPSLNQTTPPQQEGIEILRYDLSKNEVQYYTGTQWLDFKDREGGQVDLNNKRIYYGVVKTELSNYYYQQEKPREQFTIKTIPPETFWPNQNDLPNDYCVSMDYIASPTKNPLNKQLGDVSITLWSIETPTSCSSPLYGTLTFTKDNKLILGGEGDITSKHPNIFKSISEKAVSWRKPDLSKPITISYDDLNKILKKETQNNQHQLSNTFCPELFDNQYLVVYLDQPKTTC